jgi:hypothetical protein
MLKVATDSIKNLHQKGLACWIKQALSLHIIATL